LAKVSPISFSLSWALYLLAFGALVGGIYHGFSPHFSVLLKDFIWKTILYAVGLTTVFFLLAAISTVVSYEIYNILKWIPILVFVVYAVFIWRYNDLIQAIYFNIPMMIVIFIIMVYLYIVSKDTGTGKIILGLVISFLGAGIWSRKLSVNGYFNYNDIYHIIQTIGLWYIYRGALTIQKILN